MSTELPRLETEALRELARAHAGQRPCAQCAGLVCPGWEAIPGGYEKDRLRAVGTLRDPGDEDPTLTEYHPAGTHGWSPDAPIAPAFFPYNRCTVWQCAGCGRPFLRYTEYGGYYVEERIRELHVRLVVDEKLP
ncbi:MAG: hypothetical protein ACO1PB_10805 [Ramlibacter sp.]